MRISDWSSDLCSSDLLHLRDLLLRFGDKGARITAFQVHLHDDAPLAILAADLVQVFGETDLRDLGARNQLGRASCRERVCQYVLIWVVAVALEKKVLL